MLGHLIASVEVFDNGQASEADDLRLYLFPQLPRNRIPTVLTKIDLASQGTIEEPFSRSVPGSRQNPTLVADDAYS